MSNLSLQTNSSAGKENCLKCLTLLNEKSKYWRNGTDLIVFQNKTHKHLSFLNSSFFVKQTTNWILFDNTYI